MSWNEEAYLTQVSFKEILLKQVTGSRPLWFQTLVLNAGKKQMQSKMVQTIQVMWKIP